jgi:hypothetical protein
MAWSASIVPKNERLVSIWVRSRDGIERPAIQRIEHTLDSRGQPRLRGRPCLSRDIQVVSGHGFGLAADGQRRTHAGCKDKEQDDPDEGHSALVTYTRSLSAHNPYCDFSRTSD